MSALGFAIPYCLDFVRKVEEHSDILRNCLRNGTLDVDSIGDAIRWFMTNSPTSDDVHSVLDKLSDRRAMYQHLIVLDMENHFVKIYEERMISLEKHYKRCMKLQRQLLNKAMQRSSHTSSSSVSSSYSSALSSFNLRRSSQHHSQGSGSPDVPEDGQGQARDNANGGITRAALRAMSENPSPGESREPSVAEWRATTSPDTADPPVSESI